MRLFLERFLAFNRFTFHLVSLFIGPDEVDVLEIEMTKTHVIGVDSANKVDEL